MTECPVFIDYSEVRDGCLAEGAKYGATRYRKRPPDSGCQHPQVTFGTPHHGIVDVSCDGCGLEWRSIKVIDTARKERG